MDVITKIENQLSTHPLVLYMKGTPQFPQCGFSSKVAAILKDCGASFAYVNILEDFELREALKTYSKWPTYPQVYLKGELLGGCDIVSELYDNGELKKQLEAAALCVAQPQIVAA